MTEKLTMRPGRRFPLGLLQLAIGAVAVGGGWVLLADPTGAKLGMQVALLRFSPFADFMIPGLILLLAIGLGHLGGGLLTLARLPRAREAAIALGVLLMLWLIAQVWWIGLIHWLQPLFFTLGVVEGGLGAGGVRQAGSRPSSR